MAKVGPCLGSDLFSPVPRQKINALPRRKKVTEQRKLTRELVKPSKDLRNIVRWRLVRKIIGGFLKFLDVKWRLEHCSYIEPVRRLRLYRTHIPEKEEFHN
jgi:hypothetical protein